MMPMLLWGVWTHDYARMLEGNTLFYDTETAARAAAGGYYWWLRYRWGDQPVRIVVTVYINGQRVLDYVYP